MSFIWEKLARPLMFGLDAERAHELGIRALRMGLASPYYVDDPTFGGESVETLGLKFANPLGLAAGFDKNGLVVEQISRLGFGFVEVGTVTLHPQPGNPKPRLFRLPADRALINRLGFNNDGAAIVAERLARLQRRCVVGVNIGRNKDVANDDAVANYVGGLDLLHPVADYIAVNVSSPNTPGLRELQQSDHLEHLLDALQNRNHALGRKPLMIKIAPDLSDGELNSMVETCLRYSVDAIIATNTTVSRERLVTPDVGQFGAGGLSGRPLRQRSLDVVKAIYSIAGDALCVVGVGGIFSGEDASRCLEAGASLVQAYTGFVYTGPSFARSVNQELISAPAPV